MSLKIFILLGGFFPGPDGYVTSAGMHVLRTMLAGKFPTAKISTYQWSSYSDVAGEIDPGDTSVIIGYSGGGSRATWLANEHPKLAIDLMVLYDPSPWYQTKPLTGTAVKRCVCFHNLSPMFFGYGGGDTTGPMVERVDVRENHMLVQADTSLHNRTIAEIQKLTEKKAPAV